MKQFDYIISDNSIDKESLLKLESVFSLTNGYLGVRGNFEEEYSMGYPSIRGSYVNGFYDNLKASYGEKFSGYADEIQLIRNAHDVQGLEIYIAEQKVDVFSDNVLAYDRTLDMQNGISTRYIKWKTNENRIVEIKITRMVSFKVKELFNIDVEISSVDYDGNIRMVSSCNREVNHYTNEDDPRLNTERPVELEPIYSEDLNDVILLESLAPKSGQVMCTATKHLTDFKCEKKSYQDETSFCNEFFGNIKRGEKIKFLKQSAFCVGTKSDKLQNLSKQIVETNINEIDSLYAFQRKFLDQQWDRCLVKINSTDDVENSLKYCTFQLIQFSGLINNTSIPAKGLSGEGYGGHVFWDTEMFILPFYILTNPDKAKEILMFRYSQLDGARQNARNLGHKSGAAYPWRTINGHETSTFFPGGSAQYHINGDIAYSIIKYYLTTGDRDFLINYGAEVIFETARIWMEIGHFKDEEFHIDTVTGPDEYTCLVNNNYYTNCLAKYNLEWAAKIFEEFMPQNAHKLGLTKAEVEQFKSAANKMLLPYDKDLGINAQDDSFLSKKIWDFENTPKEDYPLLLNYHPMTIYRYQVCKQADVVLAHYLFAGYENADVVKKSYDYYERITTHDSSLSACTYSIMAARLGYSQKSYDYFHETLRLDLDNTHGNTKDGLHLANIGGAYLSIVAGFAGLTIDENVLALKPIMPEKWSSYSFNILYKNSVYSIHIDKKDVSATLLSGSERDIKIDKTFLSN